MECHGETHVYLKDAPYCQCGGQINAPYPLGVNVPPLQMIYGYPAHHKPPGTAPKPTPAEDVPLSRLKAAVDAKALYLSADGKRGYRDDRGNPEVCFWDAEAGKFDSWWWCEAVANDAVKL